jgi:FixJ family two-component response regulator
MWMQGETMVHYRRSQNRGLIADMLVQRPLIAIVDDEVSVRLALGRLLRASSYEVVAFGSGHEFLQSLQTRQPNCVILDYQMPEMTGRDVQRALFLANERLPVIIVTAYDQPALREKCLADGAAAYFAKPLRREQLITAIETALGHPSSGG